MLLADDTHAVNPSLLQLPFDTATAFKPVILIGTIPNMIAAHPSQPWNSFGDMIAAAKKEPESLAYATGGSGTVAHMSMKLVEQYFGIQLRQVPYRGGAPAAQDLLAGHVPMMVGFGCTVPAVMATRTLENQRDRVLTAVMSHFMSCGARLPVFALFAAGVLVCLPHMVKSRFEVSRLKRAQRAEPTWVTKVSREADASVHDVPAALPAADKSRS